MPDIENAALAAIAAAVRGLHIHDVTPTLAPDVEMFYLNSAPEVRPYSEHSTSGTASNIWQFHEHSGAHVDAPYHFDATGATIDELAPDVLFLRPFVKFDLTGLDLPPGVAATAEQLTAAAERDNLALSGGDVAIVDFGYDKYLPGGAEAREPGWWGRNQPGLDDSACRYLADAGVVAVASDTSACDLGVADGDMSAGTGHSQHFLPRGILIVEGLRALSAVPAAGLFAALPLKLAGGTASPVRVLLLTP
jgi:kynurenine formamidase